MICQLYLNQDNCIIYLYMYVTLYDCVYTIIHSVTIEQHDDVEVFYNMVLYNIQLNIMQH